MSAEEECRLVAPFQHAFDFRFWHFSDLRVQADDVRLRGHSGLRFRARLGPLLTQLYGPAVRCKPNVNKWRGLVMRICIRPLHLAFVLLAIMDIRAHPISFSERP
jgi:hypothetical protein